jgi:HSP20 family protein
MSLIRWSPFNEMNLFARRFDELFNKSPESTGFNWTPTVDIHETPEHFEVTAEIPGVRKEDMKVSLEEGMLLLSGERQNVNEKRDARMHRVERSYGHFERSFSLPESVDPDRIDASYADGVLTLKLAKRPAAKKAIKQIAVK